jgi:hypothetical protein
MNISYCDNCGKQIAGWANEYGQVMSVSIIIDSNSNGSNGIIEGTTNFCSAKCAIEYLKSYVEKEKEWLGVWKRGKILGVAPEMPKKKQRRDE